MALGTPPRAWRRSRTAAAVADGGGGRGLTALAAPASGCGGGAPDDEIEPATPVITVWILENQPDRMRARRENVLALTTGTGIRVRLVGVGDDALAARMAAAKAARRLPDVVQLPLASVHAYAREEPRRGG